MATRNAAELLGWEKVAGTIEPGKKADLLVIPDSQSDPYSSLIHLKEEDICLVMINGVPRYGDTAIMKRLNCIEEELNVGGKSKMVFLRQETQDPAVAHVSLTKASAILTESLQRVKEYAINLEQPKEPNFKKLPEVPESEVWTLALDDIDDGEICLRPESSLSEIKRFTSAFKALMAPPLSELLEPMELDPLTVVDDHDFFNRINQQPNLLEDYKFELKRLY